MLNDVIPFASCEEHLAQGDIFAISLVAPFPDPEIRIFRTVSGQHGSMVFQPDGERGQVFAYEDLLQVLESLPSTRKLQPFQQNEKGDHEMVVVHAELVACFIIASQTCDVSGIDSQPRPFASILPVVSLRDWLSQERMPIGLSPEESDDVSRWTTIVDYLQTKLGEDLTEFRNDVFALPDKVRSLIDEWSPQRNSPDRQIRNHIRSYIHKAVDNRRLYIYYLPRASDLRVPESIVDFCKLYTVSTNMLEHLKARRIVTIKPPYREQFAQKLAYYLSRVATPTPINPPEV